MNAQGPMRGQIDMSRVAVGGHSAGGAAAMSFAGSRRVLIPGAPSVSMEDSRPIAFVGVSLSSEQPA
jgi:predicted dienelactone hydrolase